jgi:hypothetical protein
MSRNKSKYSETKCGPGSCRYQLDLENAIKRFGKALQGKSIPSLPLPSLSTPVVNDLVESFSPSPSLLVTSFLPFGGDSSEKFRLVLTSHQCIRWT